VSYSTIEVLGPPMSQSRNNREGSQYESVWEDNNRSPNNKEPESSVLTIRLVRVTRDDNHRAVGARHVPILTVRSLGPVHTTQAPSGSRGMA